MLRQRKQKHSKVRSHPHRFDHFTTPRLVGANKQLHQLSMLFLAERNATPLQNSSLLPRKTISRRLEPSRALKRRPKKLRCGQLSIC